MYTDQTSEFGLPTDGPKRMRRPRRVLSL